MVVHDGSAEQAEEERKTYSSLAASKADRMEQRLSAAMSKQSCQGKLFIYIYML